MSWMRTFRGVHFDPLAPNHEHIFIDDIAHHLSQLCRYNGATSRFYSVAEHSVLLADYFAALPSLRHLTLPALMHDATETYLGDLIRPLKAHMPSYVQAERNLAAAIAYRFDLPFDQDPLITEADTRILLDESAALLACDPHTDGWNLPDNLRPLGIKITGWSPARAEQQFLQRYYELTG